MAETPQDKEQVKEPSNLEEYMRAFDNDQAQETEKSKSPSENEEKAKESDESQSEESQDKGTCESCEDTDEETKEADADKKTETKEDESKPQYQIVNEKGEKVPLVVKADGKEHSIEDMEKLQKYLEHGIHASQKLEEANKLIGGTKQKEKELEEALGQVNTYLDKIEKQKGSQSSEESESDDEDSLDEIMDPDLKKEREKRIALKKEFDELKNKEIKPLKEMLTKTAMVNVSEQLKSDMGKAFEKYPLAKNRQKEVLKKMAEKDQEGNFIYNGVDEAAKSVHTEWEKGFQGYIKEHPEYQKKTKEEAVKDYLETKKEKEKAPVSSPSEKPASKESSSKKKHDFKGIADAMEQWRKDTQGAGSKAQKS